MFKKRLITISTLPFVTALLLGSSLIISNKPQKVSAINETHEHNDGWEGVTELPEVAGDYNIYLTNNITLTETWTVPEGITNLCLNGHVINTNGENFSVITIGAGATLNLYDCGTTEHNGYVDSTGLWHYDSTGTHELLEGETAIAIAGGIITGGNTTTNGGGVNVSGTFNMYGGNIAGNTAENGGGISNISSFTMTDGNIVGNTATVNGGGVYASSLPFVNVLTGGTITDNSAEFGGGVYYKVEECFTPGTLITMADGTRQAIETLNIGDSVRVFDHEKGEISSSKIFDVWTYPEKHSGVVKLYFSNDIDVTVVYGHSFFEHEQNKYVAVTRDNVSAFVGHEFYNADNERWETLEGYEFIDGEVDTYVITTEYQLNCVANGMLSNEDGFYSLLTNIFEYGDNLKIDQVKKEQDIANFGLYGYENIKHMSKHVYDILNFQYLKVAFEKGLITENEFNYLEEYYAEVDPELYCSGKEETSLESKSGLLKAPLKAPLLTSSVSTPTPGFYVGGSIKILGNNGGNLYLSSGKTITVGTGTVGDGNGVVAPTEDMNIGITLADETGKFTTNGTADYSPNFFSDSDSYKVFFNSGDEYLELKEKTIADILPAHFPIRTGAIPENAWGNENGAKIYIYTTKLAFDGSAIPAGSFPKNLSDVVTASDGNYTCQGPDENVNVTFNMSNGKLASIVVDGYVSPKGATELNGEFKGTIVHTLKDTHDKVEPTCLTAGHEAYYECDCGAYLSNSDLTEEILDLDSWLAEDGGGYLAPLGHSFGGTVSYTWNEDECTASWKCQREGCEETQTETVTGVYVMDSAASCLENEKGHYEATFTTTGFKNRSTDSNSVVKPDTALGHHFSGDVTYTWEGDQCTASWKCDHAGCNEVQTETVTGVYVMDSAATCLENEKGHYEATFTTTGFKKRSTDANSVTKPDTALGHHFSGDVTYTWEGDKCTASWKCDRAGCTETQIEVANLDNEKVVFVEDTPATCTADAKGHYEATFTISEFEKQFTSENSVVKPNSALGHDFEPTYTWNDDKTACTAHAECSKGDWSLTNEGTITIEDGYAVATFEDDIFETQRVKLPEPAPEKSGLSGGAIAGIAIGSFVGLCLIAYIGMFFNWKKTEKALKFLVPSYKWINKKIFKK